MPEDHDHLGGLPASPRVDVCHESDGCPTVDVDPADSGPETHDDRVDPYARITVNRRRAGEQHHSPEALVDALRIALVCGVDCTADPALFSDLQQRGLITVEIGPGAHQVVLRTAAGDVLLRRLVPELADVHPPL
jgi:hypothetical protein